MSDDLRGLDVLTTLKRFKQGRADYYGLTRIGVFGSVARGEAQSDSDVDIVYETDTPNLFRASHMRHELEALMRRPVDVVRLRAQMNPRLKARIEREARYV